MAEKQANNIWKCQYCGVTSPQGHWRPKTWIEKHEENCPRNQDDYFQGVHFRSN